MGLKKRPKKNLRISVKSVGQNFHRIFAELWPLANGSRPICAAIVFGHADFADDADFFIIGCHGIYSEISCCGDYSRNFAEATCSVVADTP